MTHTSPCIPVCKKYPPNPFETYLNMYPLSLSRFLNDQVQSKRIFSSNLKEYRSDNSLDQNLIFHGWRTGHCSPGQNETWIPAYPRGSLSRGVFRGSCLPLPLPPPFVPFPGSNGIGNLRDWCTPRGWNINSSS